MNGWKTHSSFADRTVIIQQKGWFHTSIFHDLCRVPEESVLLQPTALAHVHITQIDVGVETEPSVHSS